MSREYLLRVEAVNLGALLGDTQDLSTIRGGGLALLHAIRAVEGEEELGLEAVSTGASTGIFAFRVADDREAEERRRAVERFLRAGTLRFRTAEDPPREQELHLGHATFVTDVAPSTGRFVEDRERLLARNRWRQMGSPTLAVPEGPSGAGVCGLTRILPAEGDLRGPEGRPISRSAHERREYGRAQKQRFYEAATREGEDRGEEGPEGADERYPMGFSTDFEKLASDPGRGNLHRKMAVVYLDGNAFGKLQDRHCTDRGRQREFDRQLRRHRSALLRELLDEAVEDAGFREVSGDRPIRFETLLWGGDELLWVVPAWRGWCTLRRFFQAAEAWTVRFGSGGEAEEVPLTHAGGLLFCHHKAPIYRIRELVRELADIAKGADRSRNLFAYQVLETFDHAAGDLDGFRARRTPSGIDHSSLVLDGGRMARIEDAVRELRPYLPHRQIVALAHEGLPGPASDPPASGEAPDPERRAPDPGPSPALAIPAALRAAVPDPLQGTLEELAGDLGGPERFGLHLADLWDYVGVA